MVARATARTCVCGAGRTLDLALWWDVWAGCWFSNTGGGRARCVPHPHAAFGGVGVVLVLWVVVGSLPVLNTRHGAPITRLGVLHHPPPHPETHAHTMPPFRPFRADHWLLFCRDLEASMAHVEAITGVAPRFGGRHDGKGTHNAIMSLGGDQYLELIARDPTQRELTEGRVPFRFGDLPEGMSAVMGHWAACVVHGSGGPGEPAAFDETVRPSPLLHQYVDAANRSAGDAGGGEGPPLGYTANPLQAPFSMSRGNLHWSLALPRDRDPLPADGLLPFVLDWENILPAKLHPSITAPQGLALRRAVLHAAADPPSRGASYDNITASLASLDLLHPDDKVAVARAPVGARSRIALELDTPKGPVTLSAITNEGAAVA